MKAKQTTTDLDARLKELLARELPRITDEEKEELAWKGPFEPIPFDIQAKPEAELSEKYDIFAMIRGYESEAREILKAGGYPLTVKELLGRPRKERRIRDIMNMLTYFREVRIYIRMNDPAGAALSMAYGVRSALLARIRPVEPLIEIGKSRSRKQKETRGKRITWNGFTHEQLSERNQRIIDHFQKPRKTHLTINGFSERHAEKYGLKPRQVRFILTNAVGSLPG